ncbi:MAG TPA: nucleotidyltransferase domain-containing protein, partial [bacterium]|nr:nucleotidyltransferase domain-containing protein [bacterium]
REPAGWPPINFEDLAVDQPLSDEVRRGIGELLVRKRAGDELAVGPHIHALDAFIHEHLATLSDEIHRRLTPMPHSETKTALADKRFVELLGQYRH